MMFCAVVALVCGIGLVSGRVCVCCRSYCVYCVCFVSDWMVCVGLLNYGICLFFCLFFLVMYSMVVMLGCEVDVWLMMEWISVVGSCCSGVSVSIMVFIFGLFMIVVIVCSSRLVFVDVVVLISWLDDVFGGSSILSCMSVCCVSSVVIKLFFVKVFRVSTLGLLEFLIIVVCSLCGVCWVVCSVVMLVSFLSEFICVMFVRWYSASIVVLGCLFCVV